MENIKNENDELKEVEENNNDETQKEQEQKIEVVNNIDNTQLEKILKEINKSIKYLKDNKIIEDDDDTTIYF